MTFNNPNQTNSSVWNPFEPTQRDIDRTEELAQKNPTVAGILTFFFLPAAMIYLNRGVNNLKILGYVFLIAFTMGIVFYKKDNKQQLDMMSNVVGLAGNIAIIAENTRAVTLARKRQSQTNF